MLSPIPAQSRMSGRELPRIVPARSAIFFRPLTRDYVRACTSDVQAEGTLLLMSWPAASFSMDRAALSAGRESICSVFWVQKCPAEEKRIVVATTFPFPVLRRSSRPDVKESHSSPSPNPAGTGAILSSRCNGGSFSYLPP